MVAKSLANCLMRIRLFNTFNIKVVLFKSIKLNILKRRL